jgi:hypothetical protein
MPPRPQVLFETQAAVVMMDKLAGGSGGVGPVYHGREGDGATLTLVAVRGPAGRGGASANKVFKAFHGFVEGAARRTNAGAAAQAAQAAGMRREGLRRGKRAQEDSAEESAEEGSSGES